MIPNDLTSRLISTAEPNRALLKRASQVEPESAYYLAMASHAQFEIYKSNLSYYRWKTIEQLDKVIIAFESNAKKYGVQVSYASTVVEGQQVIKSKVGVNERVYISNDELCQELQLQSFATTEKINVTRTGDGANLTIVAAAKYLIAEPAALVIQIDSLAKNKAFSRCTKLILVAGINDFITNYNQYDFFFHFDRQATLNGKSSSQLKIIHLNGEPVFPIEVVLVDNGRSSLLEHPLTRQIARCTHCGWCHSLSPVYKRLGDTKNINKTYTAIEALSQLYTLGIDTNTKLARLHTQCYTEAIVCPVGIDIKALFQLAAERCAEKGIGDTHKKWFQFIWKKATLKREAFGLLKNHSRKIIMQTVFNFMWSKKEDTPQHAPQTFNDYWKKNNNLK
ncbi:MAG: hypothetical protein IPO27_03695 [Bacteroidetes bacterium]|nr:hypothetical protein [Bacteroidota bacterium]